MSHRLIVLLSLVLLWDVSVADRPLVAGDSAPAEEAVPPVVFDYPWHRVEAIADSRPHDLYLVTEPDFPFVQDGTRDGEHIRREMHGWFLEVLRDKGRPFPNTKMRKPTVLTAKCDADPRGGQDFPSTRASVGLRSGPRKSRGIHRPATIM